jgi:hypothetical protein
MCGGARINEPLTTRRAEERAREPVPPLPQDRRPALAHRLTIRHTNGYLD